MIIGWFGSGGGWNWGLHSVPCDSPNCDYNCLEQIRLIELELAYW